MQGCSPSRKRHKADDWPRAALQQDGDVVTVTVRLPASALQHASLPSGLLSAGLSTELATSAAGVLEWLAYKLEGLGPEQSPGQRLLQVRRLYRPLSIAVKGIERRCTCTLPPHSSACMLWDCNVGTPAPYTLLAERNSVAAYLAVWPQKWTHVCRRPTLLVTARHVGS